MTERWLPVIGYEGSYEVSDLGRVRSLDRTVVQSNGRSLRLRGRILCAGKTTKGHHFVVLSRDGVQTNHRVHLLVLAAFVGPRPPGMHGLHWDDNKDNNALANLRYGSPSENMQDMVRNGLCAKTNQTHCVHGHEFTRRNTMMVGKNRKYRRCRKCSNAVRNYFHRLNRAKKMGLPLPALTYPAPDKSGVAA